MTAYTFDQIIDFTRTSAATYVANTGFVTQTPASRNLLTYTQEFDNAAWTKAGATVTANSTTAPDGTGTADTLIENSATSGHSASQAVSGTTIGLTYTATVYAKPNGRNWIILEMFGASTYASFNVATGTVGTAVGSPTTSITAVGNGWYRCTISKTIGGAITSFRVYLANADNSSSYTGDGTSGIFIWGAQLEAASSASTYTRNVGGVYPPRFDYDPVTLAPRGLLIEEQRTNLLTYSEQFDNAAWAKGNITVTANATTSPDGTVDADKLVENTASAQHQINTTATVVSATTYTWTIYVKDAGRRYFSLYPQGATSASANFDLTALTSVNGTVTTNLVSHSITDAGNGWRRCSITFTTTGTSLFVTMYLKDAPTGGSAQAYTGDGTSGLFLYGAQLEAGAFATSYIPTVASQVTRTADAAAVTGANFSRWYNQSEGTLVVEGATLSSGNLYRALAVARAAGGITDRIDLGIGSGSGGSAGRFRDDVIVGGVNQAALGDFAAFAAETPYKNALAYKTNDFASATSGANLATDTSGTVPTVALLDIGNRNGSNQINGWVRSIRYYPTRLSNTQLQALTA